MNPIEYHKQLHGKIEVISRATINSKEDLSLAYTPGVAEPCKEIAADVSKVYEYTRKSNMVAVVTDGSAVLGLGNIGPEASLPVMEGKCALFKQFADVDAFPLALATQNPDEIIETVVRIAPMFGGINLEDIAAPHCFTILKALEEQLDIPVFHDDQDGTAIVVLAGLINAAKVVNTTLSDCRVVINGAGAAGIAIARLLTAFGVGQINMIDSKGLIHNGRSDINSAKKEFAIASRGEEVKIPLQDIIVDANIFIGVSRGGALTQDMVQTMADGAIVFAMANPDPEILPHDAKAGGAAVVATGRSDFANQINNVLVFPGFFRGLLDKRIVKITQEMKLSATQALAGAVQEPNAEYIIPSPFDAGVSAKIAQAISLQ